MFEERFFYILASSIFLSLNYNLLEKICLIFFAQLILYFNVRNSSPSITSKLN